MIKNTKTETGSRIFFSIAVLKKSARNNRAPAKTGNNRAEASNVESVALNNGIKKTRKGVALINNILLILLN